MEVRLYINNGRYKFKPVQYWIHMFYENTMSHPVYEYILPE